MAPVDVVLSYLAAFDTADPAAIADHVTEDFRNEHTSALGSDSVGRLDYLDRLPRFLADFEDLHYEVEDIVAADDRVVAAYRLTTTYAGTPVDLRGVFRFEIRDALIARRVDYFDSLTFLNQTGTR